jgi:hypothetical protein
LAHILAVPPAEIFVTANVTGPGPSLIKVNVRRVPDESLEASKPRPLNVIVAGLAGPGVGVGAGEPLELPLPDGWLVPPGTVVATFPEPPCGEAVAADDPPPGRTNIRAAATPMSSAQTTPSTIEMFFQTLSSTRSSCPIHQPSAMDPAKIPPGSTSRKIAAAFTLAERLSGAAAAVVDAAATLSLPQLFGSARLHA